MMLEHGADVNTVTNGSTLLHRSLDRGEAFVRLLVEKGAKLDMKDATGRTSLDIALGVAPAAPPTPEGRGGRGSRGGAPLPGGRGGPGSAPAPVIDAATIALLRQLSAQ